jgi:hypothetical protein
VTIDAIWQGIVTGGPGFILFIGLVLFFHGDLVNGGVARQARVDALEDMSTAYEAQILLLKTRYEEMQNTWRERLAEQTRERDYYRSISLASARQTEEALTLAKDKLPRL